MKARHTLGAAFAALALTICGSLAATELQDLRRTPPVAAGDAQAGATKAATCVACHGPDGHSLVALFPALAGQSATYIHLQLQAFKSGQRTNEVMAPFAKDLTDAEIRDLASYFSSQTARPAAPGAPAAAGGAGRRLYASGDSAHGLPPCQGCHGADGRGIQASPGDRVPWHSFPTLAGQQADYIVQQLQAYRDGVRGGTTHTAIMREVVRNMSDDEMRAVAGYIANGLPPQ